MARRKQSWPKVTDLAQKPLSSFRKGKVRRPPSASELVGTMKKGRYQKKSGGRPIARPGRSRNQPRDRRGRWR